MIVRQHPSFDSHWLCRVMNSRVGLTQVMHVQYGTAQKQFNIGDAIHFSYPVPPLAEQNVIADALSDADALIESLEQLIDKKRQIKKGAMQELLSGKKRLPGFSGEWKETALGEMGKCHRGVSYKPSVDLSPFDTESTVRLLRSNNVQGAIVVTTDVQYVSSSRVSDDQRLGANDILICMANGSRDLVGKAGRFSVDDGFKYTFGAFMGCFRADSQTFDPAFVFYLFQTEQYRSHIAVLLAGSSINNLTPTNVAASSLSIPTDRVEQSAIASTLSDMDAELAALDAKLTKGRMIKQGMMQELLTGKVRLV
jgi:type I restriction enzyme S subunit